MSLVFRWRILKLLILVACLPLVGCGGDGAVKVQGSVSFDGKPIQNGSITFEPEDRKGPSQGQAIANGSYTLDGPNKVPPGTKVVRIEAFGPSGKKTSIAPGSTQMVDAMHQYVPEKYNLKSELKKTVEPGKDNVIDFDLNAARKSVV